MHLPILSAEGSLTALVPSLTYLNKLAWEHMSRNVKYLTDPGFGFITSDPDPRIMPVVTKKYSSQTYNSCAYIRMARIVF